MLSKLIAKIGYMVRLILTTPYSGWIILLQILSGLASFVGLPVLIPVLEFMQGGEGAIAQNSYIHLLVAPLRMLGLQPTFYTVLFAASALILSGQILVICSSLIAAYAKEDLLVSYREKIFDAYTKVDWLWLTDNHSGGMHHAVVQEAQLASEAHLNAQRVFINLVQMGTFLLIAMKLSFVITLLAVGVYAFIAVFSIINSHFVYRLAEAYNAHLKKLSNDIVGFQQNKKFFKASQLTGKLITAVDKVVRDISRTMKKQSVHLEMQRAGSMIGTSAFLIALILFHRQLSLNHATLLLILFIFFRIAPQFVAVSTIYAVLDSCIPMHKSLQRHLKSLEEHMEKNGTEQFLHTQPIRFENVDFSYPNGQRVLSGFNLVIEPVQTAAFVGTSGVGKSTILDLILGLLRPDRGAIYYGSISHTELDKNSLRNVTAYVGQQPSLLEGTLRENLIVGAPSATEEQVKDICRRVHIDQFVHQLPKGLDTPVGENGIKLSGGQRQRVVLGRSLFTQPKILVLDEATSELDMESEAMIQATIKELKQNMTIIIVAHRLSTVKLADVIHVVENGKIVESGTYTELLEKKGKFHFFDSLQK